MSRVVVFDDAFFCLADSGIAKMWSRVFASGVLEGACRLADLELVVLNRSGALENNGFECLDFPEFDAVHPAADRKLLSRVVKDRGASLFVSSYYTFAHGVPSMMPVYDLIPEVFGFHASERLWLERQLALAHSSLYFAISRNTALDLRRFYPFVTADEVRWAHLGVDVEMFHPRPEDETEAFRRQYGLDKFVQMVGSRYQTSGYKNGALLLAAMARDDFPKLDVVLVGGEPVTDQEASVCAAAGVKLLRLEPDDEEFALCLASASVLVFPSLYEGFGLPPLEALASGTPVIVTNSSSLPEVVGQYGLYIDGHDPAIVAHQVARASSKTWQSLIRRDGPIWASRFSWDMVAERFVEACVAAIERASEPSRDLVDTFLQDYSAVVESWQR